jgi:hypothetical protein
MNRRKTISPVDAVKARRAFDLAEITKQAQILPAPSYTFNVGDEVIIGNLRDVKVIKVFEGGKFYEISYTSIDTNYGNPVTHKDQTRFVTWLEIRPPVDNVEHNLIKNEDLQLRYGQTVLMTFFGKLYYFRVNMNPVYQRDYVWSPDDNVRLIDSIFRNINIGTFAFIHLPYRDGEPTYEILDGKQRLNAIALFYENRFPYKGLYFNELNRREKHHFTDYNVSYAEVDNITEQQKLRYFYLMNRAGRVMSEEHLKKIERMIAGEE